MCVRRIAARRRGGQGDRADPRRGELAHALNETRSPYRPVALGNHQPCLNE
jgi:hypothetical protein